MDDNNNNSSNNNKERKDIKVENKSKRYGWVRLGSA